MLELFNSAVLARRKLEAVMETLEAVVSHAPVVRVERGEAMTTAGRTLDLLEN